MTGGEREDSSTFMSQPVMDQNSLQLRLDPEKLLISIELFLTGKKPIITQSADGVISEEYKTIGRSMVNEMGVQSIMSFLTMVINPQTVQGNYREDRYFDECSRIRQELAQIMVLNKKEWALKDNDRDLVMSCIMNAIKPFLSRLINNKERESYSQTFRMEERTNPNRGGYFPNPFRRN